MKKKISKIIFILIITLFMGSGDIFAAPVTKTLDMSEASWPVGSLENEYTIGSDKMKFKIADSSDSLASYFGNKTPLIFGFYQGDETGPVPSLITAVNLVNFGTNNTIDYTIELGRASEGLKNVNFKLFDVDGELGNFYRQEKYVITGYLNGTEVLPTLLGNDDIHQISGNTVLGYEPTAPIGSNSSDGVVHVSFSEAVDKITISFSINEGATINANSQPGFGLYNLNFDTPIYTIKYAPGEGGAFDEKVHSDLVYDTEMPKAPEPLAKKGYQFIGWDSDIAENVTGDVVYTAQWEKLSSNQPKKDDKDNKTDNLEDDKEKLPKTGDDSLLYSMGLLMFSLVTGGYMLIRKY